MSLVHFLSSLPLKLDGSENFMLLRCCDLFQDGLFRCTSQSSQSCPSRGLHWIHGQSVDLEGMQISMQLCRYLSSTLIRRENLTSNPNCLLSLLSYFSFSIYWIYWIPSGNLLHSYWKWPSRHSGFTHEKWWFSIAMLVYQRVWCRVAYVSNTYKSC